MDTSADRLNNQKNMWACPCNGCSKAVKQERKRIIDELNKIDIYSTSSPNAHGLKILMLEVINIGKNK